MSKIGILGGTFDPIHNGHLWLGKKAYEEYGLDWIWFMPSGCPPHKTDHHVTSQSLRQDMVRLAIEPFSCFRYSDFEIRRQGFTYTAQTLQLLDEAYPLDQFYFIIGADSLYQIEKWYHPEQVMARAVLLVAMREYEKDHPSINGQISHLKETYGAKILRLHCGEMNISSAMIRQMAGEGKDITPYVPPKVAAYIREHKLYQGQAEE